MPDVVQSSRVKEKQLSWPWRSSPTSTLMDSVGAERFSRPREVLMRYEHSSGTATQGDTEGQGHCRGWLAQRMDNLLYKPGPSARGICDLHLQSRFGI